MDDSLAKLAANLYVALIHYPVINRNKEIVTSSVTNLDLHDIARASKTFGLAGYFVVHPSPDQQALNRRIINHWGGAYGYHANPTRMEALELIQLLSSFEEAIFSVEAKTGQRPLLVGTSARKLQVKGLSLSDFKAELSRRPAILVFGTAYGLAPEWNDRLDGFLPPIDGPSDFNHLSVRSAATIYMDRLFGNRD